MNGGKEYLQMAWFTWNRNLTLQINCVEKLLLANIGITSVRVLFFIFDFYSFTVVRPFPIFFLLLLLLLFFRFCLKYIHGCFHHLKLCFFFCLRILLNFFIYLLSFSCNSIANFTNGMWNGR